MKRVGPLAQLVELRTFNPQVVGSIPTGPTNVKSRDIVPIWCLEIFAIRRGSFRLAEAGVSCSAGRLAEPSSGFGR